MINNRLLIVDNFCEVTQLLAPIADDTFYDFASHEPVPGAIYVFSRQQILANVSRVKQLVEDRVIHVVVAHPAEGAERRVHVQEPGGNSGGSVDRGAWA